MSIARQVEASPQSFKDISSEGPYWEAIQGIQEKGLINGYPDGTFRPNEQLSRKHVAQLLNNALKLKATTDTEIRYKDVSKSHPYYDAISKVSQAGIFSGDSKGNFNPDAPITRIQLAKVLDLAFNLNIKSFRYFADVNRNHWGYTHVQALYSNGITTADQSDFKPNEPVTRAHYAVFLHRALSMPAVPPSDSKTLLTTDEIVDLVYRLPFTIEMTLVNHKLQFSQFSEARPEFLKNATQSFIDNQLKKAYGDMCMECDMNLFPPLMDETDYRFEILEQTSNLIRIRTVSFDAPLKDGGFVEYTFENQAGKWKLADHDLRPLGADSFDLTKEEALQIVKKNYQLLESPSADVTFLNIKYDDVPDWYTEQSYRRTVYEIRVNTEEKSFKVVFYPHNGSFYDEQ